MDKNVQWISGRQKKNGSVLKGGSLEYPVGASSASGSQEAWRDSRFYIKLWYETGVKGTAQRESDGRTAQVGPTALYAEQQEG